jgi:hypothetical protein
MGEGQGRYIRPGAGLRGLPFSRRSGGLPWPIASPIRCLIPIPPPIWTMQCGDSGTVRGGFFVLPECRGAVEGFLPCCARSVRETLHPERVLHGDFGLP